MSRRNSRQGSSIESGPSRRQPGRRGVISPGVAVVYSAAILAAGIYLAVDGSNDKHAPVKPQKNTPSQKSTGIAPAATPEKSPSKNLSPAQRLRYDLRHAYAPGSVQLSDAKLTGFRPMLSDRAYDREVVSAHIDSEASDNVQYLSARGKLLPPHEVVVDSHNQTRQGVVNWADYPSDGDINMEVNLKPFSGAKEATRKYRLYLPALSPKGHDGNPIASLTYAGTLDITGENNSLTSITVERESKIPSVQIIYPHSTQSLNNPNGANPYFG